MSDIHFMLGAGGLAGRVVLWCVVLMVVVIVGGIVLVWLKRALCKKPSARAELFPAESLGRLRQQVTEEEFGRLKRAMLGIHADKRKNASELTPPAGDDDANSEGPSGQN